MGKMSREESCTNAGLLAALVASGVKVRLRTRGRSMAPTIRPGDTLVVAPPAGGRLAVGQVGLFQRDGRLFAHRLVADHEGDPGKRCLIFAGDNASFPDPPIATEDLIAEVVAVERRPLPRARLAAAAGLWVLLAALLLNTATAAAQGIARDSVIDGAINGANTINLSLTTANNANRYIVVGIIHSTGSGMSARSITGVTYNGGALSPIGTITEGAPLHCVAALYGGVPDVGSDLVVKVDFSGNVSASVGAQTFYNVGSVVPATGSTTGTTPAVTVTSALGDYIVDVLCSGSTTTVPSPTAAEQTERWKEAAGTFAYGAGSTRRGFATSTAMTWAWSLNNTNWALQPVRLRPTNVNAVRLESFGARRLPWGVRLGWRTGFELDNLGFHLYRERLGQRVRLTTSPITGSALSAGAGIVLHAGQVYGWNDLGVNDGAAGRYWLEVLDLDGTSTWHGPAAPDVGAPDPAALTLDARTGSIGGLPTGPFVAASRPIRAALAAPVATRGPASRLKLRVQQEGWYRLSAGALAAAGLRTDLDPARLALSRDGAEVAIRVLGQADGRLDPEDAVEFYGRGADTPWSDAGIYWLAHKPAGAGRRLAPPPSGDGLRPPDPETTSRHTVERRDRSFYFAALKNGEANNFFGPLVGPKAAALEIELEAADLRWPVDLDLRLQGVSQTHHRVAVSVNDAPAAELRLDNRRSGQLTVTLPGALWRPGANRVTLQPLAGDADVTAVDHLRVTYARPLRLQDGWLRFRAQGDRTLALEGAGEPIEAFDVTDPTSPIELPLATEGARVLVALPAGGERQVLARARSRHAQPAALEASEPAGWHQPREGADILMLAERALLAGLEPLRRQREAEGWSVLQAAVEDVYDDFHHGQKSPQAIRDLLRFARSDWRRPPRFVLLVGDASFDPRNFLAQGELDRLPTKLIDTAMLETASDEWFVAPVDGQPTDMAVGRLPVRDRAELDRLVAKIVAFGQGEGRRPSLLAYTDQAADADFEAIAQDMLGRVPADMDVSWLRRRESGGDTRPRLLSALNAGPLVVSYAGHGSEDLWAGSVLTSADAASLGNDDRPVLLLSMTCLNGLFHSVWKTGLGESMLLAERGGAVAAFASSGLTYAVDQVALNQRLLEGLLAERLTLGEAILRAKAQVADGDVRNTWILLGDPAMRVRPSQASMDGGDQGPADGGDPPAGATPRSAGGRGCSHGGAAGGAGSVPALVLVLLAGLARQARARARTRGTNAPSGRRRKAAQGTCPTRLVRKSRANVTASGS